MNKELENYLFSIEPGWFNRTDMKSSLMCFGFECANGWFPLVLSILAIARNKLKNDRLRNDFLVKSNNDVEAKRYCLEPGNFEVVQVKEKFGTLRFYFQGGDNEIEGIIRQADNYSQYICEKCGNLGILRKDHGWYVTLCDLCYTDRDREIPLSTWDKYIEADKQISAAWI